MGRWEERDTSFLNFDVVNCQYCGKVIPRRVYYAMVSAMEHPFCGPDCHRRFEQRLQQNPDRRGTAPGDEQP